MGNSCGLDALPGSLIPQGADSMSISRRTFARAILSLSFCICLIPSASAQELLAEKLAAIEKAIDAKRQELNIPGISFAIVKDDKVIYLKGLGERDVEKK